MQFYFEMMKALAFAVIETHKLVASTIIKNEIIEKMRTRLASVDRKFHYFADVHSPARERYVVIVLWQT